MYLFFGTDYYITRVFAKLCWHCGSFDEVTASFLHSHSFIDFVTIMEILQILFDNKAQLGFCNDSNNYYRLENTFRGLAKVCDEDGI